MDITPQTAAGRQIVQRYGPSGFVVSGERYTGSIILLAERTVPWAVASFDELDEPRLDEVAEIAAGCEILLLGTGPSAQLLKAAARRRLRDAGIVVDAMDTGAACRTFNILQAEDRAVAAALIGLSVGNVDKL